MKQGDVVRLKSGGPRMTISNMTVYPGGLCNIRAIWFGPDGKPSESSFNLKLVEPAGLLGRLRYRATGGSPLQVPDLA